MRVHGMLSLKLWETFDVVVVKRLSRGKTRFASGLVVALDLEPQALIFPQSHRDLVDT